MQRNPYSVHPVQVEVSGEPGQFMVSDAPQRITAMVFEKQGVKVTVSRLGVDAEENDSAIVVEARNVVTSLQGAWGDAREALAKLGFNYLGSEVVENIAVDLLADGCEHAGRAMASRQLAHQCKSLDEQLGHERIAFKEYRQSVVLLAAAAEAFINEFIALNLPKRRKEILSVRPPTAKWAVAVELATGRRIEDEAPLFEKLSELFALRNKIMHFSPEREMQWVKKRNRKTKDLRDSLKKEPQPMRHCAPVIDGAATLLRLGVEKQHYSLPGIVQSAFEGTGAPQRDVDQLAVLAKPVPRVVRRK
jgi:hypothetical protein